MIYTPSHPSYNAIVEKAKTDPRYRRLLPEGALPEQSKSPTVKRPLPCLSLGPTVEKANCNCRRQDGHTCLAGHGTVKQSSICEDCVDYKPLYPECDAGVALGFFEQPSLIELQVAAIRHHNGPQTPILIHDDHSKDPLGQRTEEVCRKLGVELVRSGRKRIGHAGGDLGPLWHGIQWAKRLNLRTLVKLSMRFVIDKSGWLAEVDRLLHNRKYALVSDACKEGPFSHPLRTEAVALDVDRWYDEDVLRRLRPRQISPMPAEVLVYQCLGRISADFGVWPLLGGADRCRPVPGVLFHTANGESEYHALATRLGVTLTEEFTCAPHSKETKDCWG